MDKVLLEIDEAVNREKFKEEIIASIRAAKTELKQAASDRLP